MDSAISLWWGAWGGLLRRPGRSFGCTVPGEHWALSHLLQGEALGTLLALGHSWAAGWTGPPGSFIIHRAPIAWMLAHGRQGTSSHNTAFAEMPASGWSLASPQPAELGSHSQAKPLLQRSLHQPWSPPLPGLAFSLLGSNSSLVVTYLSRSLRLLGRDGG